MPMMRRRADPLRADARQPSLAPQDIIDTVNEWIWPQTAGSPSLVATDIPSRCRVFRRVEFQSYYEPNLPTFVPNALQNIQALGANWVFLAPSWTYARSNPLIFSEQPGGDASGRIRLPR